MTRPNETDKSPTAPTVDRTPFETPSIAVCDLRIYARREGDRVTGRVAFPDGRPDLPIDYRSRRPGNAECGMRNAVPPDQNRNNNGVPPFPPSAFTIPHSRAAQRLGLVTRWRELCDANPDNPKTALARQAIAESGIKASVRSLQAWSRKLDLEGFGGLEDRYTRPTRRSPTIDATHATAAVQICAWWSWRIGGFDAINTGVIAVAATLPTAGYQVADVLAVIDCYYGWDADRTRYPFKPFARWIRYDFEKWLLRTCEHNDHLRGLAAMRKHHHDQNRDRKGTGRECEMRNAECGNRLPDTTDAKARRRRTNNRATRAAIRQLEIADPKLEIPAAAPNPQSPIPNPQAVPFIAAVSPGLARDVVAGAVRDGPPALRTNASPATLAEFLGTLDDSYRRLFFDAMYGDRGCRAEAVATLPIWWDSLPQATRHNIEFKVDAWSREHPHAPEAVARLRRVDMLLGQLRGPGTGLRRLAPARRLPA